nr:MAG TPA: hypothetical protein [Caudoviricetes sp.]
MRILPLFLGGIVPHFGGFVLKIVRRYDFCGN